MSGAGPYFARAFARLEALKFDSPERCLDSVAPVVPIDRRSYRLAVIQLDRGLERDPRGWGYACKGKSLLALGEYQEARIALDAAIRLERGDSRVTAWRAECAIMMGQPQEALEFAAQSEAIGPDSPWGPFFSSLACLALGRTEAAAAAAARARAAAPGEAAFAVPAALAQARQGRRADAISLLRDAAAASGRSWPHAFAGLLSAEAGDFAAARSAFDQAIRERLSPWMLIRRSEASQRLGYMEEAVADMTRAVELEPGDPALRGQRAWLYFCMRRHTAALADLAAAIAGQPRQARWFALRSDVQLILGRRREALADIEAASALAAADPSLAARRVQLRILNGKTEAALRGARALAPAEAAFWRGYAELRQGRFRGAAGRFAVAAKSGPGARRASFYRTLAASAEAVAGAAPAPGTRLMLCGLGLFPPYTASLEVLAAVRGCDVVFNNITGTEVADLLWALHPDVRPATYDARDDEKEWTDRLFAEIRKGRRVAFVTRGHAQVFGGLAFSLIARCRREGVAYQGFGALSSLDVLAASLGSRLPAPVETVEALDLPALEAGHRWDPRALLLVYFYSGVTREKLRALRKTLAAAYPADSTVYLFGPKYETDPVAVELRDLLEHLDRIHASVILAVPPRIDSGGSNS